jgi:hypothetical protein
MKAMAGLGGSVALPLVLCLVSCAAADWRSLDGIGLATGSAAPGEWLDRHPAGTARPGFTAAASHIERYVGSSVRADVVRLHVARHVWACGAAWTEARSSVHRDTSLAIAAQIRRGTWRAGIAADLRTLRFERYTQSRSLQVRTGVAITLLGGSEAWLQVDAGEPLEVIAGLLWRWGAALRLAVAQERVPGLEPRTRAGVHWGRALQLAAGYDALAGATSGGVAYDAPRWSWGYGMEAHPQLGWSHAWTLAVRR